MRTFFKRIYSLLLVSFFLFGAAHTAFAQAYVPVRDDKLNTAFSQYVTDLFKRWDATFGAATPNGTTDSLRDLISGSDPGGIAKADCKVGDTEYLAYADGTVNAQPQPDWGPWMYAYASSSALGGDLVNEVPAGARGGTAVQVNTSNSLRCLLKEVVSWQKLGMSIQLHQMLKQYIADAQTAQLNKQLMNQMSAANFNFAKSGNVVNNNGSISTQATYNINISQNRYNAKERQIEHITDQAAADPAAGNPVGSLGVCEPWRLDKAAQLVQDTRDLSDDPFNHTVAETECQLAGANPMFASENDWNSYQDNFNDPASINGGLATYFDTIVNPCDTPLGCGRILDSAASARATYQDEITNQKSANTSFVPTTAYDTTDPADPHSLDAQYGEDIQPAGTNNTITTGLVDKQYNQTQDSTQLDSQASKESQTAPTDITTNTGLAGANTLPLSTSPTAINDLVQEFYDVIQYGYYGLDDGQAGSLNTPNVTDWAEGTMLSIYDQMMFKQTSPNTDVPDDAGQNNYNQVDTGY